MKRILLITMGGTISAKGKDRLDLKDYQSGIFTGEDFLREIPELHDLANIEIDPFKNVSSTEITSTHWVTLREKVIHYLSESDFDAVVITHGTSTLEETAYFLHLTVPSNKPIILVGAQRPFTALSSDAQLNLINAVRVAIDDNAYGKGVLVVSNDQINSAREVTKTNTYRLETFQSGQLGLLGYIDPDQTVQFYRSPSRKHTIHSAFADISITYLPQVEVVYSYAGATGDLINYIASSGKYKGIVTAGTGAGLCSPSEDEALRHAIEKGLFVVRSSRVGNGRVVSNDHNREIKTLNADNLLPQKARILLMLSMLVLDQVEDMQKVFDEY